MKIKKENVQEKTEMKNCIHKPMLDYEDYYLLSEQGDVWSNYSKKYLYLQDNGNGYLMFYACKNGKKKQTLVHIAVAETFYRRIRRDQNGKAIEEVNHKDRCRYHNAANNLQILTIEQHGKFHTGENNGNTGRVMSQEQKAKTKATREAKKALDPNCYSFHKGQKRPQEVIDKRKETIKQRKLEDPDRYKKTTQTIEKIKATREAHGNLHRKHTAEELKRMSESNKGKHFQSQEQKAKTKATREANKAKDPNYYKKDRSQESIEKQKETRRLKKLEDPNYGKSMLGKHHSQETRRRMSEAAKGKPKSREQIQKMIETKRRKREQRLNSL